jgi:cysteine-rich repeat protein
LLGKGKDLGDGNCENGLGNKYYTECEGSKLKYYEYWNGRCLERTTSCAGGCSAGVCKDPEPEPKPTCENQGKVWCAEDSCTLKYTGYESDDPNKVCCGSKSCYEIKDASGIAKITAAHILNNDPLNIRSSDCSDEVRSGEFVVEWNAISDNISSVSIAILRCDNDNCDVSRTLMGERITNVRGGSEVLSGNYYITSSDTEAVSANAFSGPKQYGRVYARLLAQTSDGTYSSEYLLDGRVNRVPCVKYSVTTPTKDRIFDGAHDIAFDASESSDDDGETLTYKWEFYPGRECSNNLSSGTLVGSDVQMSFKPSGDGCMVLTASDYAISNKYSQYVRENPVAADLASKREACSNAGGFICWEAYSGCFDLETEEFVNSVEGIGTIGFAGKCCAPEYECRSKFLSPPWIGALDDLDGDRLEYSACSLMGDNSVCYTIYESSVDTDGYCQEDKCCAAELSGDNVSKTCSLDVDCGAEASKCEDGKYYLSDPLISECAGNCTCNYEWLYVGTDEDADGIDYECGDSECDRSPVVVDATKTEIEEDCEDTLDNDCDGFTDADDSDCEVTNGGGDLDPGNGGDSNFFSDEVCTGITDCDSWGDYPMCILNRCATPGQELKDYVIDGYETEDCANIECLGCESGYLHPTIIGYHLDDYDFDVEFCSGCSLDSHVFPCNKGYVCELGMCVEDSEYVGPGTPDHETDCLDGIDNDEDGLVDYYDVEECVACGNNLLEPEQGEACDDGNLVNGDGCTENCTVEVIPGCGNGLIEPDIGETCEGDNYGGVTCAEVVGFVSGNITCSDECTLDTSVCVPVYVAECGNAILDEGEECDGTVGLDYLACSDFEGYDKGNVSCMTNCTYNISACSESKDAVVVNDPARISNSGSSGNGGGSLSTDDDSAITPVDPGISLKATCSSVDKPDVGDWSICLDGNKYRDIPICNEAAGTWELQEESGTCSVSSRSSSSSLMWL